MLSRILVIVVALWVGSLWTICGVVAPSLFVVLSDRSMAGMVAGYLFRLESWLGLALGGVALALLRQSSALRNTVNAALIVVTAAAPIANEFSVRPWMEQARLAGNAQLFGLLHGVAAVFFVCACVTGLILLWRLTRPAR